VNLVLAVKLHSLVLFVVHVIKVWYRMVKVVNVMHALLDINQTLL
jgi:hypothetical protein